MPARLCSATLTETSCIMVHNRETPFIPARSDGKNVAHDFLLPIFLIEYLGTVSDAGPHDWIAQRLIPSDYPDPIVIPCPD